MSNEGTYSLRFVRDEDASEITEIYRPYVDNSIVSWEYEAPEAPEILSRIVKVKKYYPWLICEFDGCVAGYAYAAEHRDRIGYQWSVEVSIYVHEDHRRKSVAKCLYNALFKILKLQGYHVMLAIISVPNIPSVSFHRSLGFVKTAAFNEIGFKYDTWQSSEWFIKRLHDKDNKASEIVNYTAIEQLKIDSCFQESLNLISA